LWDCFAFFEALAADAAEGHVLGVAKLVVFAFVAREVFAADKTGLREADVVVEDFAEGFKELVDVIAVGDTVSAV
jgi:hypothetical protein